MTTKQLVVGVLLGAERAGKLMSGRTLLQKVTYFVSRAMKMDAGYRAHLYGPYSPSVRAAAGSLVQWGLISESETTVDLGFAGHDSPGVRYDYRVLRPAIERALERLEEKPRKDIERAASIAETVLEISDNAFDLSLAAKLYYLWAQEGKALTLAEYVQKAGDKGWLLEPKQVRQGAKILGQLMKRLKLDRS